MTITLASLREQVRERSDMQRSEFVSDSELDLYINNSYFELYDLLTSRYEDYFLKLDEDTGLPPQFTLAGGTYTYSLPSDFYKLLGFDLLMDAGLDSWMSLTKFNFNERSILQNNNLVVTWARPQAQYRVMGTKVFFLPQTYASGTYRFWYIPKCAAMTEADEDQIDMLEALEQWSDYVVVDAAIKCLTKEESDPSVFVLQKEQLKQRIEALGTNRDSGEPERIADVNTTNIGNYGGWGTGWP